MNKSDRRRYRRLRRSIKGIRKVAYTIQNSTADAFKPLLSALHQESEANRIGWKEEFEHREHVEEVLGCVVRASWKARLIFAFTGRVHIEGV